MSLPKPYYSRDGITIYHGDCLALLPELPSGSVLITDPPYGIGHKCNFKERGRGALAECNNYPDVAGDDRPFDPSHLLQLNLPTVLWGANHFADKLPPSGGWLVWDKIRPDDLDQATCELAWTNCVKGVRRFSHMWHGMIRDSEREENYHPTQKPVALMRWVLSLRWIPAVAVIDPYMGSGPMAVACIQAGRVYIGIELSEAYCAIAAKRCEDAFDSQGLYRQQETP